MPCMRHLPPDIPRASAPHLEQAELAKNAVAAVADGGDSFDRPPSAGLRSELDEVAVRVRVASRPYLLTAAVQGLVTGARLDRSKIQGWLPVSARSAIHQSLLQTPLRGTCGHPTVRPACQRQLLWGASMKTAHTGARATPPALRESQQG